MRKQVKIGGISLATSCLIAAGAVATTQPASDGAHAPGTIGSARTKLESVKDTLGWDLDGTTPILISGEEAAERLAVACSSNSAVPFAIFNGTANSQIHEHLMSKGELSAAVLLETDDGAVLLVPWEDNPSLISTTDSYGGLLFPDSGLCNTSLTYHGRYGEGCGTCFSSNNQACTGCGWAIPTFPQDDLFVLDVEPYEPLPNWPY